MKKLILSLFAFLAILTSIKLVPVQAEDKDTITFAISGDPLSTNPINTSDRWGLTYTNMVFSPLVRLEPDGTEVNVLAESVETSEDGKSIHVKLKEDVVWSDGTPFTADDVVFTYTTKAKKENGNADSLWINDEPIAVEKVGDYEVEFKLPVVNAAALSNITYEVFIIPEHIYKDFTDFSGGELPADPVGTGPYKLTEYRPGEYMSFEANEHYFDGQPEVEQIILRIISNNDTATAALQAGEVDGGIFSPRDLESMNTEGYSIHPYSESRVGYIGFNLNAEAFQDVKVRQAVMYALNRNDYNQAIYLSDDYYENAYSIFPPESPWVADDVEKYEHNLEKSQALLQEAGAAGISLKMGISADDPNQALIGPLVQQQLGQVGIQVELLSLDQATLTKEQLNPESTMFDLFVGGYIMGQEPDGYKALFTSEGSYNYFKYKNEEVDQLFTAGAVELDEEKRKDIYMDVQRKIAEDAIIYPMVDNKRLLVVKDGIEGIEESRLIPIYQFEDWSKLSIK